MERSNFFSFPKVVSLMCHMLSDAGRMGAREGRR